VYMVSYIVVPLTEHDHVVVALVITFVTCNSRVTEWKIKYVNTSLCRTFELKSHGRQGV